MKPLPLPACLVGAGAGRLTAAREERPGRGNASAVPAAVSLR